MEAVREEEYVTVQVHDAQLGRIEALIERSLARQEAIASEIRGEIRELRGEMAGLRGEMKALDAKIDGVEKKMDARIDGVEKKMDARFDHLEDEIALTKDRIEDLQGGKSNSIALWAIAAAIIIGVIQLFVK